MNKFLYIPLYIALLCLLTDGAAAQARRAKRTKTAKPAPAVTAPAPAPTPANAPVSGSGPKRNLRPGVEIGPAHSSAVAAPQFFYEYVRPGFTYERILIAHDDAGRGQISFLKSGFGELMTDPVELSTVTVSKIKEALAAMNFFTSNDSYQYEKDYAHLGNITFSAKLDRRERTVKFNWTVNKHAKVLMDEYRKITNEYTWRFEILTARQNQPLLTPGLMETVEGYLSRGEISDPAHLRPFLLELSSDERLPLMARNRAGTLIKQIDKAKK